MAHSPIGFLSLLTLLLLLGSCQTPKTLIESAPTGATIYLDGQKVGKTPKKITCKYPGKRHLELALAQKNRESLIADLRPTAPFWIFPLDFPYDMVKAIFSTSPELKLSFTMKPAASKEDKAPTAEDILLITRRAKDLGLKKDI